MTYFTDEQVKLLLRPIHPLRVLERDGMSYVEGYDIRAELTRVFGFGRWSSEILDQALICETEVKTKTYTDKHGNEKGGRPAWYVVYRSRVRLTIHAPDGTAVTCHDGSHVGESTHPVRGEAHGNALTNSETYALRRCAINLGDQFGLSLYNKGSLEPIVRWTLVRPEAGGEPADTNDVPQVSAEDSGSSSETGDAAEAGRDEPPEEPSGEAWLNGALKSAAGLSTLEACTALWHKSVEKVHDGTCTKDGAAKVQEVLRRRMKELKNAPPALDPDDLWAQKVADLASDSEAEAALDEIAQLAVAGTMNLDRADRIETAIRARFPTAGRGEAEAA